MRKTSLKLCKTRIGGIPFYRVTAPKLGGGRIRRHFKNRAEAETFLHLQRVELANHGPAAHLGFGSGAGGGGGVQCEAARCHQVLPRASARGGEERSVGDVVAELLAAREADGRNGYVLASPLPDVERASERETEIEIFTLAETARLLESADGGTLPHWAIGAFAGLRRAEIERLVWGKVDFEDGYIEVKAAKAKTGSRRLVPMSENLRQWLAPYRNATGPICPVGLRKKLEAVATAQGCALNGRGTRCGIPLEATACPS